MRRNLKTILVQAGHTVVGEAINGGQAQLMYRTHVPDLVTMDITMPNVNGIEAVKLIRKEYPDAKIVMVSALDQRSMVLEALKEGAKHYIIKPIDSETVIKVVNKVLGINIPEPMEAREEKLPEDTLPEDTLPEEKQPETNPPQFENSDPFTIENNDNAFHITLFPSINDESFTSLTQAVHGLLLVKPLKVVLNFGLIETLPDSLLAKAEDMVKAIKNVKGSIKVVSSNKNFVKIVKERGINNLAEIIEASN